MRHIGTFVQSADDEDTSFGQPFGPLEMANHSPRRVARRPFYPLLAVFAASCLLGTLATDIVYWRTANIMWADFSDWFVFAGVDVGYLTIVVALIEIFALRSGRFRRRSWRYAIGLMLALLLATFDMPMHTRDAWTSVVPWGLVRSAAIAVMILATAWMTREMDDFADVEVMASGPSQKRRHPDVLS